MIKRFLAASGFVAIMLLIFACESKIVSPSKKDPMLSISINMTDASPKLLAAVDQYRVIVVDPSVPKILADSPLTFNNNGFVVGQIDSLPSGINLEFTAQAFDSQFVPIFSGTTNAILEPQELNNVFIRLSPVRPLFKCTPRYNVIAGSDTGIHSVDIKIFNVDSLYGVSFLVRFDPAFVRLGSAKLDSSLNPATIIFFQNDTADTLGSYKALAVTNTIPNTSIVGSDSDAVLVNLNFNLVLPFTVPDTTFLILELTGLTHVNQSQIDPSKLYIDETVIEIRP